MYHYYFYYYYFYYQYYNSYQCLTVDVEQKVGVVDPEVAVLRADGQLIAKRGGHLDQYASSL